jgi:DNA polymerase III delta prime subunit
MNVDHFLWVEKYRPKDVESCVLCSDTKKIALAFVAQGRIPHMLLSGGAGTGKTTLAKAMCNMVGAEWIIINASHDNGIDTIRTKISQFASTVSFSDAKKVVILDEADHITPPAQAALRGMMEEYSANCTFILTCNYKNRIIDAIHSRCKCIDYKIPTTEKPELAGAFFKRVCNILDGESIEYDKKTVAELVQKNFPDFRRCLNELQSYSASGKIDSGILLNMNDESFKVLISALKNKKFTEMRKWVANNKDIDTTILFNDFFEKAEDLLEPSSVPNVILYMADYLFKASFVANQEINTTAFLTELMMNPAIKWK